MKLRIERAKPEMPTLSVNELEKDHWYVVVSGPISAGMLVFGTAIGVTVGGRPSLSLLLLPSCRFLPADMTTVREGKDSYLFANPLAPTAETINGEHAVPWGWYEVVEAPGHLPCYVLAVCVEGGLTLIAWDKTTYTRDLASCTLRPLNPGDRIVFEEE